MSQLLNNLWDLLLPTVCPHLFLCGLATKDHSFSLFLSFISPHLVLWRHKLSLTFFRHWLYISVIFIISVYRFSVCPWVLQNLLFLPALCEKAGQVKSMLDRVIGREAEVHPGFIFIYVCVCVGTWHERAGSRKEGQNQKRDTGRQSTHSRL